MRGTRARSIRKAAQTAAALSGVGVAVLLLPQAAGADGIGPSADPDSCAVYINGLSGESYYPASSEPSGYVATPGRAQTIHVLDNDCVSNLATTTTVITPTTPIDENGNVAGAVAQVGDDLVFTPAAGFTGDASFTYSSVQDDPSFRKPHQSNPSFDGTTYGPVAAVSIYVTPVFCLPPGSTILLRRLDFLPDPGCPDPTTTVPDPDPTTSNPAPDPTDTTSDPAPIPDPTTSSPAPDPTDTTSDPAPDPTSDPDPVTTVPTDPSSGPSTDAPGTTSTSSSSSAAGPIASGAPGSDVSSVTVGPSLAPAASIGPATNTVAASSSKPLASTGTDSRDYLLGGLALLGGGSLLVVAGTRRRPAGAHAAGRGRSH